MQAAIQRRGKGLKRFGLEWLLCAFLLIPMSWGCGPASERSADQAAPESEAVTPAGQEAAAPAPEASEQPAASVPSPAAKGDSSATRAFLEENLPALSKTLRVNEKSTVEILSVEPLLGGALQKVELRVIGPFKQNVYSTFYITPDHSRVIVGRFFEFGKRAMSRVNPAWIPTEGAPSKGSPDAPVTLIEFGDFQCPFCAKARADVDRIMKEYEGKVRLVFKSYAQDGHDWAVPAARAAFCAAEQRPEAFFEMKNDFQDAIDVITAATVEDVGEIKAKKLVPDLDLDKFKACVGENKTVIDKKVIAVNQEEGNSIGVRLIPTFVVNGYLVVGADSYDELKDAVERALDEAENGASGTP